MEKVSARMFFSTLWRGICQVIGWVFGLFGYKREGKFARCLWGLFATLATILLLLTTFVASSEVYYKQKYWHDIRNCHSGYCRHDKIMSRDVVIHGNCQGYYAVKNTQTDEITLENLMWIKWPVNATDTLVLYSTGTKRGYFNRYTGEVTLPARYTHAWAFSEGIASVEEGGVVKFIDSKGNMVFDRTLLYNPNHDGYMFHSGHCIVDADNDGKYGLMDTKGMTVLAEEYDSLTFSKDHSYWTMRKGNLSCVTDKDLKTIIPMMECDITICSDAIDVMMADNTIRKYDLQGNLINDFCIEYMANLEYELEETYLHVNEEQNGQSVAYPEHKMARAKLCRYGAGNRKEGLITADGHMVTLPKYNQIYALGPDLYSCYDDRGHAELLNGKGERVK